MKAQQIIDEVEIEQEKKYNARDQIIERVRKIMEEKNVN